VGSYGRSPKLYLWDLQDPSSGKTKDGLQLPKYTFPASGGHSNAVVDVAWSPNGKYVASGSYDTTIIVWQVDEI
jgi:WD40 repeat protein